MKESYYADVKKKFLGKSFDYLVENGLENTSLRELCKETKISLGSVYYWFEGKEEMFIDATEFGLKRVSQKIFDCAFQNIHSLSGFLDGCLKEVKRNVKQLRFICQTASSPIYGERLRKVASTFTDTYDRYCYELVKKTNCDFEDVKAVIYLLISAVCDYVIWENNQKLDDQIVFIKKRLKNVMGD